MIDLWKKRALYMMRKGMDRTEALYTLFDKCILLKKVCANNVPIVDFDLIVCDMAEIMNNENLKAIALKFLESAHYKQANVCFLKEKIFVSDSTKSVQRVF